jgi:hypothetical protein
MKKSDLRAFRSRNAELYKKQMLKQLDELTKMVESGTIIGFTWGASIHAGRGEQGTYCGWTGDMRALTAIGLAEETKRCVQKAIDGVE